MLCENLLIYLSQKLHPLKYLKQNYFVRNAMLGAHNCGNIYMFYIQKNDNKIFKCCIAFQF